MSNNCGTVRLLLVIATLTGGCGPTAPTRRDSQLGGLVEQQGGLVRLQGAVQSSAFQPLSDVTVEVLNGPSAGLTTRTDASGVFSFAGTFDRTESFRASKEGYTSATQPYGLHTAFVLKNLAPAVDIRGDYTLTISVDPECTFPEAAQTRTFTARIDGHGQVSGAILVEDQSEFATYFDGDTVVFSTEFDGQPWLVEQLGPTEYLAFHGTATATVQPPLTTVSIPFRGYIEHCLLTAPATTYRGCTPSQKVTRCTSQSHRLTLTRR